MKYRQRRGSLHLGMRVERSIGLVCALLANQYRDHTKRPEPFTIEDFAEHHDRPKPTLEEVMVSWN